MLFKQATVRVMDASKLPPPTELNAMLSRAEFKPCGAREAMSAGFVFPVNDDARVEGVLFNQDPDAIPRQEFLHCLRSEGQLFAMMCWRVDEKILPASVINAALKEKVKQVEASNERKVGRKEREHLKDELIFDMLPRAFVRTKLTYAYLDYRTGWLVVNGNEQACKTIAWELFSQNDDRFSMSSSRLRTANPLCHTVTNWIAERRVPEAFTVNQSITLEHQSESIRIKDLPVLDSGEVRSFIDNGMRATKVSLSWNQRVWFDADANLSLSKIHFGDHLIEDIRQRVEPDDALQEFDCGFFITATELHQLFGALVDALGGIEQ